MAVFTSRSLCCIAALGCAMAGFAATGSARAGSETVLYAFQGGNDGDSPDAGLINLRGTLYGTTYVGGPAKCHQPKVRGGCGTVFSVTTAGIEKVVHNFNGAGDGKLPAGGFAKVGGALYGTTSAEGANGYGTVFKVTKEGRLKTLYAFKGGSDGANPQAGLVDVGGMLYGTTYAGGASSLGTVFAVTKAGAETVLYSFKGGADDGANPQAGLTNVGGVLYGTTLYGGGAAPCTNNDAVTGCGTVFKVTTGGAEALLHSFQYNGKDGVAPYAGLINVGGTLYGTTYWGGTGYARAKRGRPDCSYRCGTVFSVTTAGVETIVYSFQDGNDGADPTASLISVGNTLYGTTSLGGPYSCGSPNESSACGTVFKVTTEGVERVVHSFQGGADGWNPQAGLIKFGGRLYGTTFEGGGGSCRDANSGCGTVFSITR
jgi:uncharacterized repeat protein (TIGR03803 family)